MEKLPFYINVWHLDDRNDGFSQEGSNIREEATYRMMYEPGVNKLIGEGWELVDRQVDHEGDSSYLLRRFYPANERPKTIEEANPRRPTDVVLDFEQYIIETA